MAGKRIAGLFAGIGGLELGLHDAGFRTELLCEIDPNAQKVLRARFPDVTLAPDVRTLKQLPEVDVVTAGFPCQDLSQAGGKRGISGSQSGLVEHLLRLLNKSRRRPEWLIVENVSYMLRLDQGHAMRYLTSALEELGYRWAYRVVDARSFGVPQRRLRVLLVAARKSDPRCVLFADDVTDEKFITRRLQAPLVIDRHGPNHVEVIPEKTYGFYWTEGRIGIGWTTDAVPTIKGGSGLGIPSPPAVWVPYTNTWGVPTIEDGERLQGFPSDWTKPVIGEKGGRAAGVRWKLIGNAVCSRMVSWLGRRLVNPGEYVYKNEQLHEGGVWPNAAYGFDGKVFAVVLSVWPVLENGPVLYKFLSQPLVPLSERAATGFLDRVKRTPKIVYARSFVRGLEKYIRSISNAQLSLRLVS